MNLIEINEHTKNMEVGERLRLTGIPDNIYHATNGIGSTNLKRFIDSPAGFKYGDGFEQKDCFDLGSAVHTLVLEPHLFDDAYVMMPETIPRKAGKKWDMFKEMNEVYAEFFGDHKPARFAVEVSRLPLDVLVEIDAIVAK